MKDLLLLVADKAQKSLLEALLARMPRVEGWPTTPSYACVVYPNRDAGFNFGFRPLTDQKQMTRWYRSTLATALLAGVWLLTACKKNDDRPAPTACLDGRITPAAAASRVFISPVDTFTYRGSYSAVPDANGDFTVCGLPATTYIVSTHETNGYVDLFMQNIVVRAGATTHLGILPIHRIPTSSYQLDGVPLTGAGFCYKTPTNHRIYFYDRGTIQLLLPPVIGVGTYLLDSLSTGSYVTNQGGPCQIGQWSTAYGGSGSVVITRYDTTEHQIDGRFEFTAPHDPADTATCGRRTLRVTAGTFADVPFR